MPIRYQGTVIGHGKQEGLPLVDPKLGTGEQLLLTKSEVAACLPRNSIEQMNAVTYCEWVRSFCLSIPSSLISRILSSSHLSPSIPETIFLSSSLHFRLQPSAASADHIIVRKDHLTSTLNPPAAFAASSAAS